MAYELVGVEATGKFDKTVFGNDPTVLPDVVNPLVSGSLISKLFDSSVLEGELGEQLFTLIRPAGLKNIIDEAYVLKQASSSNKSIGGVLSGALAKAPKNVDSFGTLFDDGSFTFEAAESVIGRLSDTLPSNSYNSITQDSFSNILDIGKEVTDSLNSDGNYFNTLAGISGQNAALGQSLKGIDSGMLAGFVGGTTLDLVSKVSDLDVLGAIDELSKHVKLTDMPAIEAMNKSLSKKLAKAGLFDSLNLVVESVGIQNFNGPDIGSIAADLIKNFKLGEHVDGSMLGEYSDKVFSFLDDTKSDWLERDYGNKSSVKRLDVLSGSSPDFKRLAVENPRTSLLTALSTSSFI